VDNPYWEELQDKVHQSALHWDGNALMVGGPRMGDDGHLDFGDGIERVMLRERCVHQYAWTITDPETVEWVASFVNGGVVDPMAGTGYWAYLLAQLGISVVCYDLNPGEGNTWHPDHKPWFPVNQMDGAEAVTTYPDRTLLLAWPPYNEPVGADILGAYRGHRVIYIGEHGGCTGDSRMFDILDTAWVEVAAHRPVTWWGLHDVITIYDRAGSEKEKEIEMQEVS
jgi:hypothetical protein